MATEREATEALYRSMHTDWLLGMHEAFTLDRRNAGHDERTVAFCDLRLAIITQELEARGVERPVVR